MADRRPKRPTLSIVGPVYDEVDGIEEFHRRLQAVRAGIEIDSEVIYVDDGSRDGSLELLQKFQEEDPTVRVLSFARNFGHQVAVSAGIDHARGEATIVIDTDLQDPPELIPELLERWHDGAKMVAAVRRSRAGEPRWRRFTASLFYRLVRRITDLEIQLDAGDFRLLDHRIVDVLRQMPERDRFIRGMSSWVGFRQDTVEYDRDPRFAGESKYPLRRQVRLAMAAITSFSFAPLQMAGAVGFVLAAISMVAVPVIIVARLLGVEGLGGQTTVLSVLVFFSSVQLMFLGVFGEYLGRVYQELKQRPLYVLQYDSGVGDTDD